MTISRQLVLFGLAAVFLCLATTVTNACWCRDPGSECEKLGSNDTIFVGRVTAARDNTTQQEVIADVEYRGLGPDQTFTLEVEEKFQGVKGKTIDIVTGASDCDFWFAKGERYLVYATHGTDGKIYTSKCSGTKALNRADEDLAYLRNLPRKGAGARIYGTVIGFGPSKGIHYPQGLAGVPVRIEGQEKSYRLETDASGDYDLSGVRAGTYRISIELPNYYRQDELSEEVTVIDRGCSRQSFVPDADSCVSGVVVDEQGRAIPDIEVDLISAGPDLDTWEAIDLSVDTDPEGKFIFEKMPPGHYLLGLNLGDSPGKSFPYLTTYFPGVTDRVNAQVLNIGLGQKLNGLSLPLTGKLTQHTVEGKVIWPDGKAAPKTRVYLAYLDRTGEWQISDIVDTDADGRFSLIGFEGFDYLLIASFETGDEGEPNYLAAHAVPGQHQLKEDKEGVTLVLSLPGKDCISCETP